MARVKIGNVKPVKGVDYFTPADIKEMGESLAETALSELNGKFAPTYTYGMEDLEAGTTPLETGKLHFVYE